MAAHHGSVLQQEILDLWAAGVGRKEIAERLGCSLSAIQKVKSNPEYKKLYYERQSQEIEKLIPQAIKRLKALITDDTTQGAVQIAAIREILDRSHIRELSEVKQDINITINYE